MSPECYLCLIPMLPYHRRLVLGPPARGSVVPPTLFWIEWVCPFCGYSERPWGAPPWGKDS